MENLYSDKSIGKSTKFHVHVNVTKVEKGVGSIREAEERYFEGGLLIRWDDLQSSVRWKSDDVLYVVLSECTVAHMARLC